MPVYYEEKEERQEYIKQIIKESGVDIDSGCFASYLYRDSDYGNLGDSHDKYDEIFQKMQNRFPRTDKFKLLKDMFNVVYKLEQKYIESWRSYY